MAMVFSARIEDTVGVEQQGHGHRDRRKPITQCTIDGGGYEGDEDEDDLIHY